MAIHYYFNIIVLITFSYFQWSCQQILRPRHTAASAGLGLGGCPLLACDPSGRFSFTGNPPLSNLKLRWQNDQGLAGSPDFGCIGTSNRIVCPLRTENSTLVGLDAQTGKLVWRDSLLHFPSIPLMDFYSNVIACDGSLLVPYDSDGNLRGTPISFSPSMNPVFSLTLTDNDAFIISGYDGKLVTYLMNGVIHASIFLKASIEGVNGTFVPIITPVVAGHRAYFLTQFKPDTRGKQSMDAIPVFRLYAVDILRQAVGRMNTIWYHTFKNSRSQRKSKYSKNEHSNKKHNLKNKNLNSILTKGTMVFVTLTTQNSSSSGDVTDNEQLVDNSVNNSHIQNSDQSETLLYGFNDTGSDYEILFKINESFVALSSAVDMPSFGQNSNSTVSFWAATKTKIYKIGESGKVLQTIDLATVFGEAVVLTSKLMVVTKSSESNDKDFFLLAVSCVTNPCQGLRTQRHYVILVDVETDALLWAVATPDDRAVVGQLISLPCSNDLGYCQVESKDLIVASADGLIFALGELIN